MIEFLTGRIAMHLEYSKIKSVTPDAFAAMRQKHRISGYVKSDARDLRRIEDLLELRPGLLAGEEFYVSRYDCSCGHTLTFYDFVHTALVDAGHSKSFVLHTLLGSKFVINQARRLRCSECTSEGESLDYITPNYCCCRPDNIDPIDDDHEDERDSGYADVRE